MSSLSFNDLAVLNEELVTLKRAGVELELDLGDQQEPLELRLQMATAALAMRMARGDSLEAALCADDGSVPRGYCSLVRTIARIGEAGPVLQRLRRRAAAKRQVSAVARRALIYPLILLVLAAAAIAVNARVLGGLEGDMYRDWRIPPGPRYEILRAVADYSWWWIAALAAIAAAVAWSIWRRGERWRGLSSVRRYDALVDQAYFADQLALLLERQTPWPAATELAGGIAPPPCPADANRLNQLSNDRESVRRPASPIRNRPLLQWLLSTPLSESERLAFAQFTRDSYWNQVRRKVLTAQLSLPVALCAVIGGCAVLAQGWLVFAPWAELLAKMSSPQ